MSTEFRKKKPPLLSISSASGGLIPTTAQQPVTPADAPQVSAEHLTSRYGHPIIAMSTPSTLPGSPLDGKQLLVRHSLPVSALDSTNHVPDSVHSWSACTSASICRGSPPAGVLVLDVRSHGQYVESRVRGAISVCIPTTLLKRRTFGFARVVEFLPAEQAAMLNDVQRFRHIVFYDASTTDLRTCGKNPLFCTVQKFYEHLRDTGLLGSCQIGYVEGGFREIGHIDDMLDAEKLSDHGAEHLRPRSPFNMLPVFTGVSGPAVWLPAHAKNGSSYDTTCRLEVSQDVFDQLDRFPSWLRTAVRESRNKHNIVAENFKQLQLSQQARIQQALSRDQLGNGAVRSVESTPRKDKDTHGVLAPSLDYGSSKNSAVSPSSAVTPSSKSPNEARVVSGLDKLSIGYSFCTGDDMSKNRYLDICPYMHTRVVLSNTCDKPDYINASYVGTSSSSLQYIATQAPLPNSVGDFWKVIWDQRVPIIVMLTALASESGQVKCHKYWELGTYGEVKIVECQERRSTECNDIIVREITLESMNPGNHGQRHKVHQIYYDMWPDLGRPGSISDMLALVDIKAGLLQRHHLSNTTCPPRVLVHCSAGCGRTGTFCAIDTVIDGLKRADPQQRARVSTDLINEAVQELRSQRLSMVQVQSQLLYCYEVVIAWYYKAFCLPTSSSPRAALPKNLAPQHTEDPYLPSP